MLPGCLNGAWRHWCKGRDMRYLPILILLSFLGCSNPDSEEVIEVASAAVAEPPPSVGKPVVTVYTGGSPVYQRWADVEDEDVPFTLVEEDTRKPEWVTVYPTFHWQASGRWWKCEGMVDLATFRETWNQSHGLSKKKDGTTSPVGQSPGLNSPDSSSEKPQSSSVNQAQQPQYLSPGVQGSCSGGRCGRWQNP